MVSTARRLAMLVGLDRVAGFGCSVGNVQCATDVVASTMERMEERWRRLYAIKPDASSDGSSCEPCDETWPERWTAPVTQERDSLALVDRSRNLGLDWSARAGSSAAMAAFLMFMGYNSTEAIVRQARRVCRKLGFEHKTSLGLCPPEDGWAEHDWDRFDFRARGSNNAHLLRILLQHYDELHLTPCDLVAPRFRLIKVVRNPYDRAVSSYRWAMLYGYLGHGDGVEPTAGHSDRGLGSANASFADFLGLLLRVHRHYFDFRHLALSGLYRESGWAGHHRPQKRLFEFEFPEAIDLVVHAEDLADDRDIVAAWLQIFSNDPAPVVVAATPSGIVANAARNAVQRTASSAGVSGHTSAVGDLGYLEIKNRFAGAMPPNDDFYDHPTNALAVAELYADDLATYGYACPYDSHTEPYR
ncbi:hypothetical protein CTAYLR_003941 [Chrysophaeum taylorii]|uniref:Sulfotransferase family protein n=1 Tax=Chrysophaeum taylorii TaxID=2483200 RepID=A0AAD7U9D8_9STRA|nr:hypothetical protein CTAYLR_003941 [Chrysophaeum taylorii]